MNDIVTTSLYTTLSAVNHKFIQRKQSVETEQIIALTSAADHEMPAEAAAVVDNTRNRYTPSKTLPTTGRTGKKREERSD